MRCSTRQLCVKLAVAVVVGLSFLTTARAEISSPVRCPFCLSSPDVFWLVLRLDLVADTYAWDLQEDDCAERDAKGGCIPRHRLHHLLHHHEYGGRNINVVEVSNSAFGVASYQAHAWYAYMMPLVHGFCTSQTQARAPCFLASGNTSSTLRRCHDTADRLVIVLQHLALLHADQPGAQAVDSQLKQAASEQTIADYIKNHVWAQTASDKRLRCFLEDSSLLASTTLGSRPKLAEWYYTQTGVILDQPASFLTEHDSGRCNHSKDTEWLDIHQNYTQHA